MSFIDFVLTCCLFCGFAFLWFLIVGLIFYGIYLFFHLSDDSIPFNLANIFFLIAEGFFFFAFSYAIMFLFLKLII